MPTLSHLDKEFVAHYCNQSEGQTSPSTQAVNLQDLANHCANMVESIRQQDKHLRRLQKILKSNSKLLFQVMTLNYVLKHIKTYYLEHQIIVMKIHDANCGA